MSDNKKFKAIILFSIIATFSFSCSNNGVNKTINEIRMEFADKLWQKVNSGKTYNIVFLGDSITHLGDFEQVFKEYYCGNFGIPGDSIKDVYYRRNMVYKVNPKKLFLMIGINSLLGLDEDIDLCAFQYEVLIKDFKIHLPTTKIYIESVLPTSNAYGERVSNNAINAFNEKLKAFVEKYNLTYINLHSLYKDEEGLKISCTQDGVHLTPAAYSIWYEKIREYL